MSLHLIRICFPILVLKLGELDKCFTDSCVCMLLRKRISLHVAFFSPFSTQKFNGHDPILSIAVSDLAKLDELDQFI